MKKEEKREDKKVNFDLSTLTLDELIKVYESITNFSQFLNEKIIKEEVEAKNE